MDQATEARLEALERMVGYLLGRDLPTDSWERLSYFLATVHGQVDDPAEQKVLEATDALYHRALRSIRSSEPDPHGPA